MTDPPLHRGPHQGARVPLHARRAPDLAPAPALAPLTYSDEDRPVGEDPAVKAERSPATSRKTSIRKLADQSLAYSFHGLLAHLVTRTRNTVAVDGVNETFELLARPTTTQHRVMELIAGHLEQLTA